MSNEQKEIQINLKFHGWSGELLGIESPGGSRSFLVHKGCSVWEFLSEGLPKITQFKEFFFDLVRNDLKPDVMVILNGSMINPRGKTILRSGDSLALLRVADSG